LIEETPTRPRQSLAALHELGGRLKKLIVLDGVVSIACAVLLVLPVSFLCDYFLHLPRAVRALFWAAGMAAFVALLLRRVARPWTRPVATADLAKLVERAHPELNESLLTAVELTDSRSAGAQHVSPALLESVVRRVEQRVQAIDFGKIFDKGGVRRRGLLLALVACVVLGPLLFSAAARSFAGTGWSRNVFLSAAQWPKRTEVELVQPLENPVILAVGDSLDVEARLLRGSPAQVVVESVLSEGQAARRDPMAEAGAGLYRRVFANVVRPFEFAVRADDDSSEWVRVEVRLRPRIDMESMRIWATYPEHTGWVSTPIDEPLRYGNLRVPSGTQVRYEMATNVEVESVYFVFKGEADRVSPEAGTPPETQPQEDDAAEAPWPGEGAVALSVRDGRNFSGEFVAEQSGQYFFHFRTPEGFPTRRPDRFRLDVIMDGKPIVRVVQPARATEEVSPVATVPVRVSASDDYRLAEGELFGLYFPAGSDQGEVRSFSLTRVPTESEGGRGDEAADLDGQDDEENSGKRSRRRNKVAYELTLRMPDFVNSGGVVEPDARFKFRARVTDSAGNVGESEVHVLRVVSAEELLRILTDRLLVARDQLNESLRRQRSARNDVSAFRDKLVTQGAISPKESGRLLRHRQDQNRVTVSLKREVEEMDRILAKMAANEVGDQKWRKWVKGLRRDVDRLASERSPSVEKDLDALQKAAEAESQPLSRLSSVISEQRAVERELEALVLRLTEFGDFNALVELLREVERRQRDLKDATQRQLGGDTQEEP